MNKWKNYFVGGFASLIMACSTVAQAKMTIAIDAGHGGKDPGAIGATYNTKEKNVTLGIAKYLKSYLDGDSRFKGVMTRSSDKFILLPQRTEIARRYKADLLVSIHADSLPTAKTLKGASVWVLSNRRAGDEMGKWLEDHEKQSQLLGGAGSALSGNHDKYLDSAVLDLQFSHAQRAGYAMGKKVLQSLGRVAPLAKRSPQRASLSVLRSPDIPSILVETGFLSNKTEESNLKSKSYQKKIARAIYNGLVNYRGGTNTSSKKVVYKEAKPSSKKSTKTAKKSSKSSSSSSASTHIVKQNETLYSIAMKNGTTPEKLSKLNNIKNNRIRTGQKLKLK